MLSICPGPSARPRSPLPPHAKQAADGSTHTGLHGPWGLAVALLASTHRPTGRGCPQAQQGRMCDGHRNGYE